MMNLQQMLLAGSEKMKPILKKVIPKKILSGAKGRVLDNQLKSLLGKGKVPFERQAYPDGINLIGLVRAEMGLGQGCRLMAAMIEHTKFPLSLYNFKLGSELLRAEDHSYDRKITQELKYNINLIHINPDEMRLLYTSIGSQQWDRHYNIAFWLWEVESIPESWKQYLPLLDEIWTPSEFISKSLRKITDLPVRTIPYCVKAPVKDKYSRTYFRLPKDQFLFLAMYDSNSTRERKNPMGVICAFKSAFKPEDTGVGLVLKVNNAREEDMQLLHKMMEGYKNVYYITETMSKIQVNSLIKEVDVFVSLHRGEGFGLVMAEAMLNGTPVIATNWSSNTEFMDEKTACMVDCGFAELKEDCPPYKAGIVWADPNIETAAAYMKRLYDDKTFYMEKARLARTSIKEKLSMEKAVDLIEKRVEEIYG